MPETGRAGSEKSESSEFDDEGTAFPAGAAVPGQARSRSAYEQWRSTEPPRECTWQDDYRALRAEGWTWRQAAYIAWAASPTRIWDPESGQYLRRWPLTQEELATQVLGLSNDRAIRKWRAAQPEIVERIARLQIEPMLRHRRDVIDALVAVASSTDPRAHPDRRMFLEMTGDYSPKGTVALTGAAGGPIGLAHGIDAASLAELSDEELDTLERIAGRLAGDPD